MASQMILLGILSHMEVLKDWRQEEHILRGCSRFKTLAVKMAESVPSWTVKGRVLT